MLPRVTGIKNLESRTRTTATHIGRTGNMRGTGLHEMTTTRDQVTVVGTTETIVTTLYNPGVTAMAAKEKTVDHTLAMIINIFLYITESNVMITSVILGAKHLWDKTLTLVGSTSNFVDQV